MVVGKISMLLNRIIQTQASQAQVQNSQESQAVQKENEEGRGYLFGRISSRR